MMLVATPIDGAHYLIDVLAGIVIALLCCSSTCHGDASRTCSRSTATASKIPQLATSRLDAAIAGFRRQNFSACSAQTVELF